MIEDRKITNVIDHYCTIIIITTIMTTKTQQTAIQKPLTKI